MLIFIFYIELKNNYLVILICLNNFNNNLIKLKKNVSETHHLQLYLKIIHLIFKEKIKIILRQINIQNLNRQYDR